MRQAFLSSSPSLGLLSKKNEQKTITCITNLFKAVNMYFDNVLTQEKAEVVAAELLSKYEYRSLKLEDLVVICKRLKESDAFKMTPARILREVKVYAQDRENLAISFNKDLANKAKSSVNYQLEERLKTHYKAIGNVDKLANNRNKITTKFK